MTEDTTTKDSPRLSAWLSALLYFGAVALVVAGIMWFYPKGDVEAGAIDETTTTVAPDEVEVTVPAEYDREQDPLDEPIADAAEVILPSVVHIQTAGGVGSGVIYDSNGLVITAAHVVDGQDTVRVRFADGEQVSGTVLGAVADVDIAVIEVDRDELPAATFNTEKPRVGQTAIAIGSPWGLASTVTAGIVSAVDQTNCGSLTCASMVQTDAAINPGNSGGPLVDRDGAVIGINVSIFTETGANDGVGFAVPSDIAVTYADAIVSGDPIETAFLGVEGSDVQREGQAGTEITSVVDGSAAQVAGLETGDVVIGFGGVPIRGWLDLVAQVRAHRPGETVEILVLRDDQEIVLEAVLDVRTEDVG